VGTVPPSWLGQPATASVDTDVFAAVVVAGLVCIVVDATGEDCHCYCYYYYYYYHGMVVENYGDLVAEGLVVSGWFDGDESPMLVSRSGCDVCWVEWAFVVVVTE